MPASASSAISRPSERHALARRTLVILFRRLLGVRWGVRAARIYAGLLSVGMTATIWVLARTDGAEDTTLSLVGRSVALLTWIAGGIATMALAAPPKDAEAVHAVHSLAVTRGFDDDAIAHAEMVATVRLVAEVIVLPLSAIGVFAFAVIGATRLQSFLPIIGAIAFGALASIVLGVVAWGCRRWGRERGRSWLVVVMLLPWLVSQLVVGESTRAYLSIPGLLGRIWETLTIARGT